MSGEFLSAPATNEGGLIGAGEEIIEIGDGDDVESLGSEEKITQVDSGDLRPPELSGWAEVAFSQVTEHAEEQAKNMLLGEIDLEPSDDELKQITEFGEDIAIEGPEMSDEIDMLIDEYPETK